jgi:hypothetical protein
MPIKVPALVSPAYRQHLQLYPYKFQSRTDMLSSGRLRQPGLRVVTGVWMRAYLHLVAEFLRGVVVSGPYHCKLWKNITLKPILRKLRSVLISVDMAALSARSL